MVRVGLTGGIGSGKSTVAKVFETLGIPVYYADDAAKRLMNEDLTLRTAIMDAFGEASYTEGKLNRKWMAEQVFGNAEKLKSLNSVVHPATIRDAEEWLEKQDSPYAIKEAALIFESGAGYLDFIIGVSAPLSLRIQRTMNRDGITREDVLARMTKQLDENIKMRLCDAVIVNDGQRSIIEQVVELDRELRVKS